MVFPAAVPNSEGCSPLPFACSPNDKYEAAAVVAAAAAAAAALDSLKEKVLTDQAIPCRVHCALESGSQALDHHDLFSMQQV